MTDLIRVSDVIRLLYPSSLDFVDQEHLERGTELHEAMEIYSNNIIYGYDERKIRPEIEPVVRWLRREKVQVIAAEERMNHQYGFTGQPDCLASWNGRDVWIDFKFSESITEQNKMQGCAYSHLTGRTGLFLQCKRDGTVKAIRSKGEPHLWAAFLNGLAVLKFRQRHQPQQLTNEQIQQQADDLKEILCRTNL